MHGLQMIRVIVLLVSYSMIDYRTQAPPILREFLTYHETIQGHSKKTVDEYFLICAPFSAILKLKKAVFHGLLFSMRFPLMT